MRPVVVGIAGGSGSGKTTLVGRLLASLGADAVVLEHDRYYRDLSHVPPAGRALVNFDHPESLDTDLLVEHVRRLRSGHPVGIPTYDFSRHARGRDVELVAPRPTVIVEGILVLSHAALRDLMDVKVFVDAPAPTRFDRRLQRDVAERGRTAESVRAQYLATVQPMHDAFVEPARRHADVIVTGGGLNDTALAALVAIVRERLG